MAPGDTPARTTLHLHIGAPKTGSSAIQAFLTLNREAFQAATGIHYPESATDKRVLKGKPTSGNGAKIGKLLRAKRRGAVDEAIELAKRELGRGEAQLLLSNEGFWSVPNEAMAAFVEALNDQAEIRFLFYARPQVRHLESAYLQVLGNRGFDGDMAAYFESLGRKFFTGSKLKALSDMVGRERVTVRKYDRKALVGGDVVDDFLDAFGGRMGPQFQRPAEVNTSLDPEHYLYARAVQASSGRTGKVKRLMRTLSHDPVLSSLYAKAAPVSGIRVMDLETARRVRDAYRADNELLDRLAPEAGLHFNAENDRAVEALEAAADETPEGLSRLELLLLSRLAQLESQLAELRGQGDGDDELEDDED
jgi:hypothetical protein